MGMTEQLEKIALEVAAEVDDGTGEQMFTDTEGWVVEFAKRLIAALPKPEPVGHFIPDSIERPVIWNQVKRGQGLPLYREPTIAPPASEQKPVAYLLSSEGEAELGHWFAETNTAVPGIEYKPLYLAPQLDYKAQRDTAWKELREIREAIGANAEEATVDEVRRVVAQRDALLEASKQLLIAVKHLRPCPGTVATMEAAIASVKGGE